MLKSVAIMALLGRVSCGGGAINYIKIGEEWVDDTSSSCGGDFQSPIDLQSNFTQVDYAKDNFFKHYEDLDAAADGFQYKSKWIADGYTVKIEFNDQLAAKDVTTWKSNYFTSDYMNLTNEFKVAQFHFHSQSEHTFDGVYYDLEMHSVHLPDVDEENGYFGAVMGLMFDTTKYDESITDEEVEIIDTFFDQLLMDKLDVDTKASPVSEVDIAYLNYGQLMNMARTTNRFVYTGSLTTPPCTEKVYWNVINRVHPIKERHLGAFKHLLLQQKRQETDETKYTIGEKGNIRLIQEIKKQEPRLMMIDPEGSDKVAQENLNRALTIILLVVCVMIIIISGLIYLIKQYEEDIKKRKSMKSQMSINQQEDVEVAPSFTTNTKLQNKADDLPKMSSGNFGSEIEDSARGIDNNMQRAGYNGDPSPSQVMQQHGNK